MKLPVIITLAVFVSGCARHEYSISVANDLDFDRNGEVVEMDASEIMAEYGKEFIISDNSGKEIPWQVTHDGKLIFPVDVKANSTSEYSILKGQPADIAAVTECIFRPDCQDDIAWENENSGYRLYGPSFRASGGKVYGYDIWSKCVTHPIVNKLYDDDHKRGISYHVDHGEGFDGYTVGPTLGGGMCAPVDSAGNLCYPCAYRTYEILDNGPLRVKVRFEIDPVSVDNDSVTETRVITLDSGSWLNKTDIAYSGADKNFPVAMGIVVHSDNQKFTISENNNYVSYSDLSDNVKAGNGEIYVGVLAADTDSAGYRPFPETVANAIGETVIYGKYRPGSDLTYYWGSAWSKANVKSEKEWNNILDREAQKIKSPLKVKIMK